MTLGLSMSEAFLSEVIAAASGLFGAVLGGGWPHGDRSRLSELRLKI
jgi:hypothetical protein